MFCPNCGLQQADARNFCLRCGCDLTKKYEKLPEIAAGSTPGGYVAPPVEPEEPEVFEDEFDTEPELQQDEPQEGPAPRGPVAQTPYAGPQQFLITQTPIKVPLGNLGLRRLVCLPTFLGCLGLGAFSFISSYEELAKCIDKFEEPSFGWAVLVTMCIVVGLGIIQALIGMGTIYSWQALSVAFVMSAVCAFVGLNYMPGTWKERLIVFGVFVVCALVEAASAIGPIERKKRTPKVRPSTREPAPRKSAAVTKKNACKEGEVSRMYSYGSLFAQTVQEQNELFKRLRQKNSIDGRRTSIICLTRSGAPTPSLVLPGGSTLRIVPCDTGAEEPLSQESAYRLWQMHDASRRKGNMLFVCSDESDVAAHSVARGFLRAHWPAPTACKDNPTLNKSILQMMCDIRYLDQWGMWPPDETVKKAPLEPDGLRLILSGPGAWWRIFLMEKGREQGVFKYMIRTHTPDVVDISDSNTHCGTKYSVSEFGDSLHAIVVPQAPLRTCSSTSSLEDKYR